MSTMKLEKLKTEGKLQTGDYISTEQLGRCRVATIESTHTITVVSSEGKYYPFWVFDVAIDEPSGPYGVNMGTLKKLGLDESKKISAHWID